MHPLPENIGPTVAMPTKMSRSNSPPNNNSSAYMSGLKRKGSSVRRNGVSQAKPFKVIVLGQASVGKTAMTVRFVTRRFIYEYDPTLETIYKHRTFFENESAPVDFEILDTAGQEEKIEEKLKWADAFIIAYSINDRCSFEEVARLKFLAGRCKKSSSHEQAILIVGNKKDLEYDRLVQREEGLELARSMNCSFVEVSARESYEDVVGAFERLYMDHKNRKRTSSNSPKFTLRRKTSVGTKQDLDSNPPRPRARSTSFALTTPVYTRRMALAGFDGGSSSPVGSDSCDTIDE
ncbi:ras-related and estrogen-regulated growth inhibitor-like [Acanthaster planci]|uniref:small monomeric GTPase n=1 Tax=Acanthaster planci TaxID=133434 RepID=A0A8B8A2J8_ACAPL|nr:ras-related and estrogen-regulated growth inhibitor-like [Acanthaster planci]XP_022111909.1 ras-related and estrogen-regulated growth inhibitor-like [Acanthaster planci]XP_022111910.1 ras-related and estrogen-regulated growth inhibitor-like [Acanthaster planci]XP_022111911.1 ras-related and estrogen-regulated growth inhibitor-like [Acanthaster planci]